jgi:8-oxo-dGTP diphosphatase
MQAPGVITTARLRLRPFDRDDVDALPPIVGDFEVSRWLARVPYPYDRTYALAYVEGAIRDAETGEGLTYAIEIDGALAGAVGFYSIDDVPRLGYWLARRHWGHGYMTEAARAVVAHGFGALGFDRIESGVFEGNDASMKIQTKLGFRPFRVRPVLSRARGMELPHIDTVLDRARHEEFNR